MNTPRPSDNEISTLKPANAPDVAPRRPSSPRDRQARGLLALVTLFGLVLRLWAIGWSLPDARHPFATYHPDETVNLAAARQVDIPHGQLDTKFYSYGTLYFYLASFAQTFGRGWHLIPETPQATANEASLAAPVSMASYAAENAALFLAGRLVSALLGVATIPLVFALGTRLYGRRVGLAGSLLYAVAPLAVVHAHFFTVDVAATFFVTLALLQSARLLTLSTTKQYALTGIAVGLCAATKYNTALVLIAPLVAHFLRSTSLASLPGETQSGAPLPPDAARETGKGVVKLGLLLVAALAAFLVACPGPLLNWDAFWNGTYPGSGVRYELFQHSREGHGTLFTDTGLGWWYHLVVSLRFGLGDILLLAGLVGLFFALRRRTRGDIVLLAFFLLYYGVSGLSAVRFARYMLPLFPVLCLFAARLFMSVNRGEARQSEAKPRTAALVPALFGIVVLAPLLYSLTLLSAMSRPDPRDVAANYLEKNAAPGASIAFAKVPWFWSPPLSPRFGLPAAPQRALAAQETMRFALRIPTQEWDTSVLAPPPDYVVVSNLETMHDVYRLAQPNATAWMNVATAHSRSLEFGPPFLLGPSLKSRIVPEDILYVVPTISIFTRF